MSNIIAMGEAVTAKLEGLDAFIVPVYLGSEWYTAHGSRAPINRADFINLYSRLTGEGVVSVRQDGTQFIEDTPDVEKDVMWFGMYGIGDGARSRLESKLNEKVERLNIALTKELNSRLCVEAYY